MMMGWRKSNEPKKKLKPMRRTEKTTFVVGHAVLLDTERSAFKIKRWSNSVGNSESSTT